MREWTIPRGPLDVDSVARPELEDVRGGLQDRGADKSMFGRRIGIYCGDIEKIIRQGSVRRAGRKKVLREDVGVARDGVADASPLVELEVGVGKARVSTSEEGARDFLDRDGPSMVWVCDLLPHVERTIDAF